MVLVKCTIMVETKLSCNSTAMAVGCQTGAPVTWRLLVTLLYMYSQTLNLKAVTFCISKLQKG